MLTQETLLQLLTLYSLCTFVGRFTLYQLFCFAFVTTSSNTGDTSPPFSITFTANLLLQSHTSTAYLHRLFNISPHNRRPNTSHIPIPGGLLLVPISHQQMIHPATAFGFCFGIASAIAITTSAISFSSTSPYRSCMDYQRSVHLITTTTQWKAADAFCAKA